MADHWADVHVPSGNIAAKFESCDWAPKWPQAQSSVIICKNYRGEPSWMPPFCLSASSMLSCTSEKIKIYCLCLQTWAWLIVSLAACDYVKRCTLSNGLPLGGNPRGDKVITCLFYYVCWEFPVARNELNLLEDMSGCIHFPHSYVEKVMGGNISTCFPT